MVMSSRFSIKLYGDSLGALLARYWTRKMQYYYDIYLSSGKKHHKYTEAEHAGFLDPADMSAAIAQRGERHSHGQYETS